ncbi:aldehyde dehydrogenase [Agrocybe pediades]|nr:aldehyde dehydrogenase [Agrocybe pediades]
MAPHNTQLYINGKFVPSSSGETFEVRNPYSGEVVGLAASASSADCKAAIAAASRAFKTWQYVPAEERIAILAKATQLLATDKYRDKILQGNQEETASVAYWAMVDWFGALSIMKEETNVAEHLKKSVQPSAIPGGEVTVQRRPMGVIFGIAPWNGPFALAIRAVAIAIACGNTAVLKGSEATPKTQGIVAELFHEAGLPAGVLNVLSFSRENAPALTAEVIAHPAVRHINFTGSDRVGKIIAVEAGKHLKPCVLELGGKSPAVVLNDANVEEAARCIVSSSMSHSGQVCIASSRVIVQSQVADKLLAVIKGIVSSLKAGDVVHDSSVQMGPLFTEASAENALAMVKDAQANGAELVIGDVTRKGAVIQPHVLKNVKPGTWLWDREVFGPVLSFAVVETVDEAVELANSTDYSLSASLWTNNTSLAPEIASKIYSGYVNINGPTLHSEPIACLVGLGGSSGYGTFDVEHFTNRRVIVTHPYGRQLPLVQ